MLFNSLPFLYLFLPVTYFVFWRLRTKVQRYVWLTITGYIFYSFWNPKFCALMALSTAVSYGAGLGLLRWKDARRRRLCLVVPIVFDLSLLGTFKYANFVLSSSNWLFQAVHLNFRALSFDIVLPIGISFYTFHTITYIVDSYRGVITPTRNVFEFSCYVSLFSQLVAGPIVRFRQVDRDLENIDHANQAGNLERGWSFFVLGMAKKVLIADSIAYIINPALTRWQSLPSRRASRLLKCLSSGLLANYIVAFCFAFWLYTLLLGSREDASPAYVYGAKKLAGFSYTLYLTHFPALLLLRGLLNPQGNWQPDPWHLACAFGIGMLILSYAYWVAEFTEARTARVRSRLLRLTVPLGNETHS
jgi:D-alanyl-lipoteichoic acid acyltransferase DltB (MBOAT superfamily)